MKRTREIKADNGDYSVVLKVRFNAGSHLTSREQVFRYENLTNAIFDALRTKFDATEIKIKQ